MANEFRAEFSGEDDAKAQIRAAVRYLLQGIAGSDRGDVVQQIVAIVNEVALGLPPGGSDPLDEGMPGG
jgi:hypothetical protein